MSDKCMDITVIDSLNGKTDEELFCFITELGLSMPPLFLKEVYRYLAVENIAPSYELLRFFDTVFCASARKPQNLTLGEIATEDTEVMRTFLDVCQKASYLKKATAFPITDILEISSEYLNTLDVKPPSSVSVGDSLCISDEEGNFLVNLGIDDEKPLRYGYAKENEKINNDKYMPESSNASLKIPTNKIITPDGEINIKNGFINRLLSFEEKPCVKIESDKIAPTRYEKLFYTTPEDEERRELFEAAEIRNHIVSARCTSHLSFGDGINTVLDSLFALLAKGADRRKVGITVKLGIRRENLSGAVGALLGAYRAIMELCLPQINSELVFADEEYIICTAFAPKSEMHYSEADLLIEVRRVYLLSFKRFDNSLPPHMPDFEGVRKMCDRLYSDINERTVLAVHALNGTVSSVIKEIPITKEAGSISEDTIAQGFVIEAKSFAKIDASLIGIKNSENKNTEEKL